MTRLLVLNGPNLNLLGTREPEIYGTDTLADIDTRLKFQVAADGHDLSSFQSNAEHEIVERIHRAREERVDCIIINPGAFTHTSIAIRDAFLAVGIPFIEVHLSNVFAREDFRQHSYLSDQAVGLISGLGAKGYEFAVQAALDLISRT